MKNKILFLLLISFYQLFSQTTTKPLNLFIDCSICDQTSIKQELTNVSFVRDKNDSDVHAFFTIQRNANGGMAYEIEFIGKNKYKGIHDIYYFDTHSDTSEVEETDKIVKYLRFGLFRFWIKNGLADKISVSIKEDLKKSNEDVIDPWNKWSFSIGANGWFNGEERSEFSNLNANVSAQRVTDENKFKFRVGVTQNKSTFKYGDELIVSEKKSFYIYVRDVVSINNNWSIGFFSNNGSSLFRNYRYYFSLKPGVEYNFFPYSESSKRQLVIAYKVGGRFNKYFETTIFNKDTEFLWKQNASIAATFRKKWGSLSAEFEYQNYLHDMTLDAMSVHLNTNIRIFKGLSLRFYGGYGITHNQINIASEGATLEEMLLQQKQIRSGYQYWGNVGLNYRFGSIYNSIVNPRFGD